MHYLPGTIFRSNDHRNPHSERRYICTSADLSLRPLYLHHVGKLSSYLLRYDLDANELVISDLRCGMLCDLSNLIGGVAMTQAIFRALTGQEQQPQLAIVSSPHW
jgi:hypothetical protein